MLIENFRRKYKDAIEKWGLLSLGHHCCDPYDCANCGRCPNHIRTVVFGHKQTGLWHRLDGPAIIDFWRGGSISYENYFVNNRRHREDGPAVIYYQDGKISSKSYYIHDVEVPEFVVMQPELIDLESIAGEDNIEVKRIKIERYGWLKYLKAIKSNIIDEQMDEISGTSEMLITCGMRVKMLICACPSTARVYPIQVPYRTRTCDAAQRWLKGMRHRRMQIVGAS